MKKYILSITSFLLIISCGQSQKMNDKKENYLLDDLNIYVEKFPPNESTSIDYTVDNNIYKIDRKFIFDYFIVRQNDTFKIVAPKTTSLNSDFQREWDFISSAADHENKIETISITVLPGISNENQTMLKYEYQYANDLGYSSFSSKSGVIENEMNVWMHPHRDKYFMILELNPFPYVRMPLKTGTKWSWNLKIGDHWKDIRWKTWEGLVENEYKYKIIRKEKLLTDIGEMECWVIEGVATSSLGLTELTAYYNELNGFVKLDYTNIDKSRLIIKIKEIR
ncbi:MAG: hypothetical protein O9294_11850 [Cytophagales bacterium]|jgi:hypothetical protein|nr:hypothetical protein [Cytophagales bacterium]